jgi:hypothetical protein
MVEDIAKLLKEGAWPALVLIVLVAFGLPLWRIFWSLGGFIGRLRSLKLGEHLEFDARVGAFESRLAGLEGNQGLVASFIQRTGRNEIPQELRELAVKFDSIQRDTVPDYTERVQARNQLADEMAMIVVHQGVDREKLMNELSPGISAALASAIALYPRTSDLGAVMQASSRSLPLQVRYRWVIAVNSMVARRVVAAEDAARLTSALGQMMAGADAPLARAINNAISLISVTFNRSVNSTQS